MISDEFHHGQFQHRELGAEQEVTAPRERPAIMIQQKGVWVVLRGGHSLPQVCGSSSAMLWTVLMKLMKDVAKQEVFFYRRGGQSELREMLARSLLRELVFWTKIQKYFDYRAEETLGRKYQRLKDYLIMREDSKNDWVGTEARQIQMRNKVSHFQSEKD